jgi:predicted nucleotidyltransferase
MGSPAPPGVANLLFGSVRRDVLALLLGHPDERFYFRELLRATGGGSGALQRELRSLVQAGLLNRERAGNQVYFSANRDASIFPELRSIIEKTAGAPDVLRTALGSLVSRGRIDVAFVYGSAATGGLTSDSDVDLLVIGDATLADLVPALRDAEGRLRREVNVSLYPAHEFRQKASKRSHFLTRVLDGAKLFVTGDERELERLAR